MYITPKSVTRLQSRLREYLVLLGKQRCCTEQEVKGRKKNKRKILSEMQA